MIGPRRYSSYSQTYQSNTPDFPRVASVFFFHTDDMSYLFLSFTRLFFFFFSSSFSPSAKRLMYYKCLQLYAHRSFIRLIVVTEEFSPNTGSRRPTMLVISLRIPNICRINHARPYRCIVAPGFSSKSI